MNWGDFQRKESNIHFIQNFLRTYNLVPQNVGKFLALSKEKFHLRTQHSVLLGKFWMSLMIIKIFKNSCRLLDNWAGRPEPGCSCLEVWWVNVEVESCIWVWLLDSYSQRAGVRAKLAGDTSWQQEYFQKILPWLQHQDNLTMKRHHKRSVGIGSLRNSCWRGANMSKFSVEEK